ncbi:FLYWCH zinc finger domain containing protein [Brugia malayi]|uniref:Vesicle-fusing ATPase n=1 Tax=Brugia malayi TaxID=6279 RepID=A0A0H5S547_BRUMA|nr:FLYWCH zinc finger domain containing protein [Brugia malayi]CRZ23729.1 Bm2401 [Brugia malayi]VIO95886.1 FLYWCH zinc finger domain containing protein [Brugia malayi]
MDSEYGNRYENNNDNNSEHSGKTILLTTTRHRYKLQDDGYFYVFDKMSRNGQKKFWRCEKKGTCNARIHTDAATNEVLKRTTQHNHPSSLVRPEMQRKALKRHFDGSSTSDKVLTKKTAQSLEALLHEIIKTSKFDLHQIEEILKSLKREYSDMISHYDIHSSTVNHLKSTSPITTTAILTADMIAKSFLQTSISSASIEQQISANSGMEKLNTSAEGIDGFQPLLYLTNGDFIFWSNEINEIVDDGTQFCSMASNSNLSKSFSLLIKGAEKTGKSCLAVLIAKNSGIPSIKSCLPENMLKLNEKAKNEKLIDLFEEAIKLPQCILFLDSIELLIEYCDVGDRYSNVILQTVKLILKKGEMLKNNRLLVIATVTTECAEKFGLQRYFSSLIEVPLLMKIDRIMPVIECANVLNKADFEVLQECLIHDANSSYPVGIKSLLTTIELTKHSTPTSRFHTFLRHLLQWKQ